LTDRIIIGDALQSLKTLDKVVDAFCQPEVVRVEHGAEIEGDEI